ncbi:glycosyltransferase family A protein [Bifidobacterium mongoliense]|uniref:glycosyltransferase family 2 protein n=1 Tax=Bifidobacterium mongoliense TaxID=518643 RepID=UPI0030ECFC08
MKKVSVIVPITADRISDLDISLRSLMDEQKCSLEIIIVLNGPGVFGVDVTRWESNNVKFIRTAKSGPSVARNIGTSNASGSWICYLDSDDVMRSDGLQKLVSAGELSNADVVIGDFIKTNSDKVIEDHHAFEHSVQWTEGSSLLFLGPVLLPTYQLGYIWGRLFSTKFLNDNQISFDEALKYGEDYEFMVRVSLAASRINYIPSQLYEHRVNLKSLTKRYDSEYIDQNRAVLSKIHSDIYSSKEFIKSEKNVRDEVLSFYFAFVLLILSSIIVDNLFHPENHAPLTLKRKKYLYLLSEESFNEALLNGDVRLLDWKHGIIIRAARKRLFLLDGLFAWFRHFLLK